MCSKTKDEVIKDLNKREEKKNKKDKLVEDVCINEGKYLILGSDNFWYGSAFDTQKEAEEEIKTIKKNITDYGNPENHDTQSEVPNNFYIYFAHLVKEL